MNQQSDNSTPAAEETAKKTPGWRLPALLISLLAVFILLAAAIWYVTQVQPFPSGLLPGMAGAQKPGFEDGATAQTNVPGESAQVDDDALPGLTARLEKLEQAASSGKEGGEQIARAEEDVARLKNDLIAMTAALGALQAQIKQESRTAGAAQSAAKTQVAEAVAFVQLRSAIDSGDDFSRPLQTLQQAAVHDAAVTAVIAQIEPTAANGILPMTALYDEFLALKPAAQTEMRKTEAHTWKERLLAELQRFVSVRPLHGPSGGEGDLADIDRDLARNHLKAALEKAKSLPDPAQTVLKDWLAKAEARQGVETALDAIAAHLVEQAQEEGSPAAITPAAEE
ncbi:MAG: hypothetical protein PHY92_00830 [Alphaproteobacteria bacterium]|nr:hypothetical protein [Alphaproteobacteria bacterium]